MRLLGALSALAALGTALARSSTGDRVLVVLDTDVDRVAYSKFWASLQDRGFTLDFRAPKDDGAVLQRHGEKTYDHLIVFAPSAKAFSPALSPQAILHAQATHLNTLYLLSPALSELQRDTFREYDLEFLARDSYLVDAFASAPESQATLVVPPAALGSGPVISDATRTSTGPLVVPSAIGHVAGLNPYLIDIVKAPKTAFVHDDEDDEGGRTDVVAGSRVGIVSAMQNRENVRIGWVGSAGIASDEHWGANVEVDGKSVPTANAAFMADLTSWLFQETGVVRLVSTAHRRAAEAAPRDAYRIKDELVFSLVLSTYTGAANSSVAQVQEEWAPFEANDVQLDFTMLDPHVRTALRPVSAVRVDGGKGTVYEATFRAPDRHGVFKFVVEWWRPGWSYVRTASTASVVPFRHDEYPRFIVGAWPFYASAASASAMFLVFCALWVGLGDSGKKKAE
ncbi:oligosaccharyl transferase glycoprotein complex, beta subunit [Cryptotrichosporon argae]